MFLFFISIAGSGAVIARSSQPLVGLMMNMRSNSDEKLVASFCTQLAGHKGARRKLYIVDARPRKNALANGAKGGGSESSSNYLQSEVCTWPKVVWSSIFCLLELLVLTDNVFSSDCFFGDRQHTCNERELFPP
jgi:hypothetical protein